MTYGTHEVVHHHGRPWRAALLGAVTFTALAFLFWASAAAQAMPEATPTWITSFTPEEGMRRLVMGLILSAIVGMLAVGGASVIAQRLRSGARR